MSKRRGGTLQKAIESLAEQAFGAIVRQIGDKLQADVEHARALYVQQLRASRLRLAQAIEKELSGAQAKAEAREEEKEEDPLEKAYRTIGVDGDADEALVRAVYLAKAKRMHPDHGGNTQKFQELEAAYDLVKRHLKRRGG